MKIAIHHEEWAFSTNWIKYLEKNNISYKILNFYSNDIIKDITDCDIVMWHHSHLYSKDKLFAKQFLFSLEQAGKLVFPNFNSSWHFDDKLGQKYLLEAIGAPIPNTYVFYSKYEALKWINSTEFPKVFKLRAGAGSNNVFLVKTKNKARKLIYKSFTKGFSVYNKWNNIKNSITGYKRGKLNLFHIVKSIGRVIYSTKLARTIGKEKGYVLFQDFIPNNSYDIRVIVIGYRAFAIKRLVRKNDFRASGSGNNLYGKNNFNNDIIKLSFNMARRLNAQCVAFDYVFDSYLKPLIVEINYGFDQRGYFDCPGFWDKELNWHEEKFIPEEWMVELMIEDYNKSKNELLSK